MNEHVPFERFVADRFTDAERVAPPPHSVDRVLIEARRMRPLPRWLALVRESPLRIASRVVVGSPTMRLAYLSLIALLVGLLVLGGIVAGASLLPGPAPVAGCGQVFCPGGPLADGRNTHTATRLQDGRVLITGGLASPADVPDNNLATAELWDPGTGTASLTGPMHDARAWHTATLLKDGRVLVVGSENEHDASVLASAELWDPGTGLFTLTGSLAVGRGYHVATLLGDGRVLIVGGVTDNHVMLPTAEVWDPDSGTFSPAGSMAESRTAPAIALLPDDTVLVAGGGGGIGFTSLASAELWDPTSMTFSPAASLLEPRIAPTATLLPDGSVLIIGGGCSTRPYLSTAESWDLRSRSFQPAGGLAEPRGCFSATGLLDGRVLIIGGESASPTGYLATAEIWDPIVRTFGPAGTMAEPRSGPMATLLDDGRVLVTGGWSAGPPRTAAASTEIWDPKALDLTASPMP